MLVLKIYYHKNSFSHKKWSLNNCKHALLLVLNAVTVKIVYQTQFKAFLKFKLYTWSAKNIEKFAKISDKIKLHFIKTHFGNF